MSKILTFSNSPIEKLRFGNRKKSEKESRIVTSRFLKRTCFIITIILCLSFSYIAPFANGPGERVYKIFSENNSNAVTSQQSVVDYFTALLVSWFNGLGPLVPILAVSMILIGIIIALITSFSKRTRALGTGTASFAFIVFLVWLFIPTIINLGPNTATGGEQPVQQTIPEPGDPGFIGPVQQPIPEPGDPDFIGPVQQSPNSGD